MLERGNLSRRGFLTRSMTALTMGAGLPVWFAREQVALAEQSLALQNQQVQANDRITVGFIGTGSRAGQLINQINRTHRNHLQIVAACDVDNNHLNQGVQRIGGNNVARFRDFRELVARQDIDVFFVVTPDHWHTIPAAAAMQAGKDVYCEKPLTLTINEGKHLVRVSRQTNKLMQVGSQQRTEYGGRFRLACELVRNNRIGRVHTIRTVIGDNPVGGPFQVQPVPDHLNWNFWLGPTPMVEYIPQRCHYTFRWWYDYSGGKMTDWGAHHNDVAQWALDMDDSGPVAVQRVNAVEPSDNPRSYNCHPRFEVRFTYANGPNGANGTVVRCMNRDTELNIGNGVRFEGENNQWIFVSRGTLQASDPQILNAPLPQNAERLPVADNHIGNFIQCVRNRQQPICNVNVGHRSVTVCHLGTIALRHLQNGQSLQWNPQQERFTGNGAEAANSYLSRPSRTEQQWGGDA